MSLLDLVQENTAHFFLLKCFMMIQNIKYLKFLNLFGSCYNQNPKPIHKNHLFSPKFAGFFC